MFETRVTQMLDIRYPIIQGSMALLANAELAAAVSNAGGLGVLSGVTFPQEEALRREISRTQDMTSRPFGVNVPIGRFDLLRVLIEERVKVLVTSARNPEPFVAPAKEAGLKMIHVCAGVRYAQTAERLGVDAVVMVGTEAGGHPSIIDVTTCTLVPQTVDVVQIPVVAGGGVGDARGFLAARVLGAEGVQVGTRFIATKECIAHPNYKRAVIAAGSGETVLLERTLGRASRVLRNSVAEKYLQREAEGASPEELLGFLSEEGRRRAALEGDLDAGVLYAGQVCGSICEVLSVEEVIQGMVEGARALWQRLGS